MAYAEYISQRIERGKSIEERGENEVLTTCGVPTIGGHADWEATSGRQRDRHRKYLLQKPMQKGGVTETNPYCARQHRKKKSLHRKIWDDTQDQQKKYQ